MRGSVPDRSLDVFPTHTLVRLTRLKGRGGLLGSMTVETKSQMKITMDGKYAFRKDPHTQVRILCVDRPNHYAPIISLDGTGWARNHYSHGGYNHESSYPHDYDLVPLKEKFPEKFPDLWVNFYEGGLMFHRSEELAKYACSGAGKTVKYIPVPDQDNV